VNTFYRIWLFALAIKLIIGATLPFSNDEAYYWVWSHHLQLGYFDHPGMIAWLVKLGHPLDTFGLRWPAIILGHMSWICWYLVFKQQLTGRRMILWALLMLLNPLLGWGTFLAIPDTPAVFFWSLCTLSFLKWIETLEIKWALVFGASFGLGFNSKYQLVLILPCLLIWLFWVRGWKKLNYKHLPAIIITAIIFSLPVFYWNFHNHFDSFMFQLGHGLKSEAPRLVWPLEYLGSQMGLLFPTVFLLSIIPPSNKNEKFLYVCGWFTILFFFGTSFSARPEGNWPILGYAPLITLAALRVKRSKLLWGTAYVWAFCFVLVLSEAYWRWIPVADKSNFKTSEFERYDDFIPYLKSEIPVYASSFQMAAMLNFKTRTPIYKLRTLSRKDFYDYLPDSEPPPHGRFIVLANRETDFSQTILQKYKFVNEVHFKDDKKIIVYEVP